MMTNHDQIPQMPKLKEIPEELYNKLNYLGLLESETRDYHVGESNYSEKFIQPWTIFLSYPELTYFDHDIIKRVLRVKEVKGISVDEARLLDYNKILHIVQERIRQLT